MPNLIGMARWSDDTTPSIVDGDKIHSLMSVTMDLAQITELLDFCKAVESMDMKACICRAIDRVGEKDSYWDIGIINPEYTDDDTEA